MLREADALPFNLKAVSKTAPCRACGDFSEETNRGPIFDEASKLYGHICMGHPRRWWWPFGRHCVIFAPHFHMKCASCGHKWLMAPRYIDLGDTP